MLYLDSHESVEFELALAQCVEVERVPLNQDGLPDIWWVDVTGTQQGKENKQAGELLGSLSDVKEQLQRELANVDRLGLTIRGIITPTVDGYCQTWRRAKDNPRIMVADQVYRTHYKSYAEWVSRIEEHGIPVKEAADLNGLVLHIVADYENSMKPGYSHHGFDQLIVTKQQLNEWDPDKRKVALQFMGCVPGVGEEIALALADRFPSIVTLINTLESGADKEIAALPLRTGKRTIGPSAVMKMKGALGL